VEAVEEEAAAVRAVAQAAACQARCRCCRNRG
jgi:hypothetical protein